MPFSNKHYDELYTTPKTVIHKMIAGVDFDHGFILDPSAGRGDILESIQNLGRFDPRHSRLYACEVNPELRAILTDKGFAVVWDDFLTYTPRLQFTHVVMNPPFSVGVRHLLHAWEIVAAGGMIVCLLNAENLRGKTGFEDVLLKLIKDHGSAEDIGPVFERAERSTKANIALVRLTKPPDENEPGIEFNFKNDRQDHVINGDEATEVGFTGFVESLLATFDAAVGTYAEYARKRQQIVRYAAPFNRHIRDSLKTALDYADEQGAPREMFNVFVAEITDQAWQRILDHPRFQSFLTDRARKEMDKFRDGQKRVDFTEHNVRAMFDALLLKREEFLMGAVLDAFETCTRYHKDNRVHVEGWKSDLAWKCNRRVVLPYFLSFWKGSGHGSINYRYSDQLNDVDRAMCVVSGRNYDEIITIQRALTDAMNNHSGPGTADSTFFGIKYFLKGTMHLHFKDEDTWKRFNYLAAKGRGWLPPGEVDPTEPKEKPQPRAKPKRAPEPASTVEQTAQIEVPPQAIVVHVGRPVPMFRNPPPVPIVAGEQASMFEEPG